jgi:hypothetical protein
MYHLLGVEKYCIVHKLQMPLKCVAGFSLEVAHPPARGIELADHRIYVVCGTVVLRLYQYLWWCDKPSVGEYGGRFMLNAAMRF